MAAQASVCGSHALPRRSIASRIAAPSSTSVSAVLNFIETSAGCNRTSAGTCSNHPAITSAPMTIAAALAIFAPAVNCAAIRAPFDGVGTACPTGAP